MSFTSLRCFARAARTPGVLIALVAAGLAVGAAPTPFTRQAQAATSFTFDGGGYGHGVGMSQWGAKGRADAGQSVAQIIAAYYKDTQITPRTTSPLRVHLASSASSTVQLTGSVTWSVNGVAKVNSGAGETLTVKAVGNAIRLQPIAPTTLSEITLAGPGDLVSIALTKGQPVQLGASGHRYQYGRMTFRLKDASTLEIVEDGITMQQYLYGIAEVPASWPTEALKAQALAARTYAVSRQLAPRSSTFDLYSTDWDQVYNGVDKEQSLQSDRWIGAVDATNDQVITYDSQPITAFYFSSSGGATENSEYVFITPLPYTRATSDPYDNSVGNPYFRWSRTYSGTELGAWIKASRGYDVGEVTDLDYSGQFGASGRIDRATIKVTGTKGTATLSGSQLQFAINANAPGSRQLLSSFVFIRPQAAFDSASFAPGGVRVSGWAFYPGSSATVQVTVDGKTAGTVPADNERLDVAATIPGAPSRSGFDTVVPVEKATSTVCVNTTVGASANTFAIGCKTVTVPTQPFGAFDVASNAGSSVRVEGWAADPQAAGPIAVHVYVDGKMAGGLDAGRTRSDLLGAIPAWGPAHGFDGVLPAEPGLRQVCAYAINVGPGSNQLLGCRSVTILPPHAAKPFGYLDVVKNDNGDLAVAGWAIDPDTTGPIDVHVYIDGVIAGGLRAANERIDVATAFPTFGKKHGFDASFAVAPGLHTACAYAINDGPPDHTLLGCRTVNVTARDVAAPFGALDVVQRTPGGIDFEGWAIDPDTVAPITVHLYVGSFGIGTTADRTRNDVDAAFHRGADHGFAFTVPAATSPQLACAYAINNNGTGPHTLLGCRTV